MVKRERKKIGIVIPVANEEKTIRTFSQVLIDEIKKLKAKIIVFFIIDNASKDNTREILNEIAKNNSAVKIIFSPNNKHVVDAYIKGYKQALKFSCDVAIDMDSGFSHSPSQLAQFIDAFNKGYDCVFGIRPLWSSSYKVPLIRRIYSLIGTLVSNLLLGTHFHDYTSGYVGYKASVLRKILKRPLYSVGHFWHVEMRYRAHLYKYLEVPIDYKAPSKRVSKKIMFNSLYTLFTLFKQRLMLYIPLHSFF